MKPGPASNFIPSNVSTKLRGNWFDGLIVAIVILATLAMIAVCALQLSS